MIVIKLLNYKDIEKILSFEDFENFIEANREGLINKIFFELGFSQEKLKLIPKDQKSLFEFIVIKDFLVQSLVVRKAYEDFNYEEILPLTFLTLNFGFFKVISQTEKSITLENIQSSSIKRYKKKSQQNFPEGQLVFAMTFFEEGEFFIDKNFVPVFDDEVDNISDILLDFPSKDEKEIFVELIMVGRLLKSFLLKIEDLVASYDRDLVLNFPPDELTRFFNHLQSLAKYIFSAGVDGDLYELDYYKFLQDQCQAGNFVVEGDLESFIEIMSFIMDLASEDLGYELGAKAHLERAQDNIFSLRQDLVKNYSFTDYDTIDLIDFIVAKDSDQVNKLVMVKFFMEILASYGQLKLTMKDHIHLNSIKEILSEYFADYKNGNQENFEELRILLDLAFSILFANNLVIVLEKNQIYPTDRLNFFLDDDLVLALANILKGLFRKETFIHYLGKAEKTGQETFNKTMEAIKTNNFYNFGKDKKEEDIIKVLKVLNIIIEKSHQGEVFYELSPIGEFIQEQESDKDKKAKIIQLDDFR